jgi:serine protease
MQLTVAHPMRVHVAIYDVLGRRVRTLLDGAVAAASRPLLWDGRAEQGPPVSSGIYFVRATSPAGRRVVRIPLIR